MSRRALPPFVAACCVAVLVLACVPAEPNPRPAALSRNADGLPSVMALLCPDDIVRDVTFSAYPDSDDRTVTGRRVELARVAATDEVPATRPEFVVFDMGDVPSAFTPQGEVREAVPRTGFVEVVVRLDDGFRIEALAALAELREGLVLDAAGAYLEPKAFEARSGDQCGD